MKQKLYCYVDETGQDKGSDIFIVVAVIVFTDIEQLRKILIELEKITKVGRTKWHKQRQQNRVDFLGQFLQKRLPGISIFYGQYKKPVPYYFPTIETIEKSIKSLSGWNHSRVLAFIDGLDRQSAKKFTNALRMSDLKISLVKGVRDESEVLIRLADRWAGCLRMASKGHKDYKDLIQRAVSRGLLKEI